MLPFNLTIGVRKLSWIVLQLLAMRLIYYLLSACVMLFFWGCEMPPLYVYFRNYSNQTVHLYVTLDSKKNFPRLPNRVTFYDTASKRKTLCGNQRDDQMVDWMDTNHFTIAIPPHTIIDINDIATGNRRNFDLLLVAITSNKTDTLINTGNYLLHNKFHFTGGFSKYKYYYDFE